MTWGSHGGDYEDGDRLIALMMEAVQTSETLVNSYQSTRIYNQEDSHLSAFSLVHIACWVKSR
jgi:predicted transcriptional regulator